MATQTRICSGRGDCWESNGADYKYPDIICNHNCQRMSCVNARVCGTVNVPGWVANLMNGCCIGCNYQTGFRKPLEFSEDECPVCLETKECVTLLNCTHKQCVDCFKRCRFGGTPPPQPEFPYPELEDEYYDDSLAPKWKNDTLVEKWLQDLDKWDAERSVEYQKEESLRVSVFLWHPTPSLCSSFTHSYRDFKQSGFAFLESARLYFFSTLSDILSLIIV